MNAWNALTGLLLQIQGSDTVLVRQLEPSLFHRVADVAGGLVNIFLVLVVLALIPLLVIVMRMVRQLTALLEHVRGEIRPITQHAVSVADNVNYISTAVRADVQRVSDTVNSANQRVNEMLDVAEDRVRELHAVLDVVQEEAQETLLSAAVTMHGVRAGAAAFRDQLAEDVSGDGTDDDLEFPEDDSLYEADGGGTHHTGPRIRRRGGRHGKA
jgi:hypothetical protein